MYKGIKSLIEGKWGKIKRPQMESEVSISEDKSLDQLLELFCATWNILAEVTEKYGKSFTRAELDRIQCLDLELSMLREDILNSL